MNKHTENAMRTHETAMTGSFIRGLDIAEGDIVQVRPPGHNSGRIGKVIGVTYYANKKDLRITVMFSDKESAMFSGERLDRVRSSRGED